MLKTTILEILDRVLQFAAAHTDTAGRMIVDGEIDCKDPGWLILSGVIRGQEAGWNTTGYDLLEICRRWTAAAVDVDDTRSAWTTFALLYAMYLSGGKDGIFYGSLSTAEKTAVDRFIMQLDMKYLREASKNYQVAAGFIDALRIRFGYLRPDQPECHPDDSVKIMLDGYLGDGFFNDDDTRGSRADRRIDAYSAEIIGLLLHYDEIHDWNSTWHEPIRRIVREFCAANRYLIDARGEYAKWGRSLRGEAEIKKVFLWEYAEREGLVEQPGDGLAAAAAQTAFFLSCGISPAGQIYKDKAANRGIWDEYTTHVQAQGYGAYGLALALRFANDRETALALPATSESYVRHLPGPQLIVGNQAATGIHYLVPLTNRLTKPMYLWHNRITGENDVYVDMSAKFMPLPYFGQLLPAPYAGPVLPFLPLLETPDGLLIPRNLEPRPIKITQEHGGLTVIQDFTYCRAREFEPCGNRRLTAILTCRPDGIDYAFELSGDSPAEAIVALHFCHGNGRPEASGSRATVTGNGYIIDLRFDGVEPEWRQETGAPSIYGATTPMLVARMRPQTQFGYAFNWKRSE